MSRILKNHIAIFSVVLASSVFAGVDTPLQNDCPQLFGMNFNNPFKPKALEAAANEVPGGPSGSRYKELTPGMSMEAVDVIMNSGKSWGCEFRKGKNRTYSRSYYFVESSFFSVGNDYIRVTAIFTEAEAEAEAGGDLTLSQLRYSTERKNRQIFPKQ